MRKFTLERRVQPVRGLNLEQDLNEQQRAAVTAGDGPHLVIAGAGSGKTRTITYRVAYLIEQGAHPSDILLATFTNKAAREMLDRVHAIVGGDVGRLWGGTFHSLGSRLIREHAARAGYQPNFSIIDESDQKDLIKLCVGDANIHTTRERFPSAAVLLDALSFAFNTGQTVSEALARRYPQFAHWAETITDIGHRYAEKKRRSNVLDYDDLLHQWLRLLTEHEDIRTEWGRRFRHILVDEYQDTNSVQAAIIDRMASHNGRNVMVVGDDAQSIYAFRGACGANMLEFTDRYPDAAVFKLETNYRSTPEILAFANASIACNTVQYEKRLTPVRREGVPPVLVPCNDVYQEAAFIAERVLQLRDDGMPLESMAVLYRAHAHSTMLQAELIKRNVPYEIRSGVRFFEQAHVKDVVAYLKVLTNPRDEAAWRRLLLMLPRVGQATASKIWGRLAGADDPLAAAAQDPVIAGMVGRAAQPHIRAFQSDLRRLREAAVFWTPADAIAAVVETDYSEYLKATYDNYPSRLEDLRGLAVFARQFPTVEAFLQELVLLGELYGQEVSGSAGAETERLILSTIHQAKGLEWSVVIIMRLCEGGFPSETALSDPMGEEEDRRVFYVAATRARDELYLTYPVMDLNLGRSSGSLLLQPSRFIQEISPHLYEGARIEERYVTADADDAPAVDVVPEDW